MEIGTIIRKNRLKKNLTQEEVANRLGVTAPAVNKWEKGNSMPDITLLSPIARLLDITLETLLSHTDSLSDEKANRIILTMHEKLKTEPFETVFTWAKDQLQTYPNSDFLILNIASLLHSHLQMQEVEEKEENEYTSYFINCYQRVLESENQSHKTAAANALYNHHMNCQQFDKAEEYLNYFSAENPERKRKQAAIYRETGRKEEALRMYQELLYSGYQNIQLTFHGIYYLSMKEQEFDKAHQIAEKLNQLAQLFEMGTCHEVSPKLELAIVEKDADRFFEIMQQLLGNIESIFAFTNSPLYSHMNLKQPSTDYIEEIRQTLLAGLEKEECAFVHQDPRFDALFNK